MIDYGLWFNDSISVRQGVREAARKAAVQSSFGSFKDPVTGTSCTASGMDGVACGARAMSVTTGGTLYAKVIVASASSGAVVSTWVRGDLVYLTCAVASGAGKGNPRVCAVAGEDGAGFTTTGNGSLTITAPTTGATKGLGIISDRNNTSTLTYRGNGATANTGTVYAKTGTFDYRGNGAGIYDDSFIVVGDLSFSGNNGLVQVTYTQANNAPVTVTTDLSLTQ